MDVLFGERGGLQDAGFLMENFIARELKRAGYRAGVEVPDDVPEERAPEANGQNGEDDDNDDVDERHESDDE